MSEYDVTQIPCDLIKSLHPTDASEVIFPGTAYTVLLCSNALSTVIIAPLFFPASTTSVPSDKPEMILFLAGKCALSGGAPGGYSERTQPVSQILSYNFLFSCG